MGSCSSRSEIDWEREPVSLNHFSIHNAIGKGGFSRVKVVSYKRTDQEYALKFTEKKVILRKGTGRNYIRERNILEKLNHRYIANMRWAFQDTKYIYFVLDLMLGGDMRYHHDRNKNLGERTIKIWIAQIITSLNYIHRSCVMHRDIKMDNILLDLNGHAHITDFNCATVFRPGEWRHNHHGTRRYMAPEMVQKLGYDWRADFWSLGNLVYELFFYRHPFGYKMKSTAEIDRSIVEDELQFPPNAEELCSPECIDFIKGLLQKDMTRRLGCRGLHRGLEDLGNHPWFADINWQSVRDGTVASGFLPDPKAFNFSINHELDEFMAAEKPLTHNKKRERPRDLSTLTRQELELELQFTTYDYTKPKRDLSGHPIHREQPGAVVSMQNQSNSHVSLPNYIEATCPNSRLPPENL